MPNFFSYKHDINCLVVILTSVNHVHLWFKTPICKSVIFRFFEDHKNLYSLNGVSGLFDPGYERFKPLRALKNAYEALF